MFFFKKKVLINKKFIYFFKFLNLKNLKKKIIMKKQLNKNFAQNQKQQNSESTSLVHAYKKARASGALNLTNRDLEIFPQEICTLSDQAFDEKWWELQPIVKIDLSNNKIKSIPAEICQEKEIVLIRFINNQLVTLPSELFELIMLKSIDFSHNKLIEIPETISNCSNLVEVNLQYNELTKIPNGLVNNLEKLEVLNLSHNKITHLPCFKNLKILKKLDLSNNRIQNINKNCFINLELLENLNFFKNSIKDIEKGSFFYLNNLISLDLKENQLTEFHEFPKSEKMDNLILAFNRISNLCNIYINLKIYLKLIIF